MYSPVSSLVLGFPQPRERSPTTRHLWCQAATVVECRLPSLFLSVHRLICDHDVYIEAACVEDRCAASSEGTSWWESSIPQCMTSCPVSSCRACSYPTWNSTQPFYWSTYMQRHCLSWDNSGLIPEQKYMMLRLYVWSAFTPYDMHQNSIWLSNVWCGIQQCRWSLQNESTTHVFHTWLSQMQSQSNLHVWTWLHRRQLALA